MFRPKSTPKNLLLPRDSCGALASFSAVRVLNFCLSCFMYVKFFVTAPEQIEVKQANGASLGGVRTREGAWDGNRVIEALTQEILHFIPLGPQLGISVVDMDKHTNPLRHELHILIISLMQETGEMEKLVRVVILGFLRNLVRRFIS